VADFSFECRYSESIFKNHLITLEAIINTSSWKGYGKVIEIH